MIELKKRIGKLNKINPVIYEINKDNIKSNATQSELSQKVNDIKDRIRSVVKNDDRRRLFTKEKKAIFSLLILQGVLVLCWLPYIVILPMVSIIIFLAN